MAAKRKVGQRKAARKPKSWEAQELSDIRKYWRPRWLEPEGKRRTAKRTI